MSNNPAFSNGEFLKGLKAEQESTFRALKRMQLAGFVLASAGLLLYVYEEAERNSWLLPAYSLLTAWLAINWFVIRPLALKKRVKEDAAVILRIEDIINQL
jgi:hypothetical protein